MRISGIMSNPFTTLLILVASLTSVEAYYIIPTTSTPCPGGDGLSCFTLSQYANSSSNFVSSNITLILLPGYHALEISLVIVNAVDVKVLSFEGNLNSHSNLDTVVTCYQSRLVFENISDLYIGGITFTGCVNNFVTRTNRFTLEDCNFQGEHLYGTGIALVNVVLANVSKCTFSSHTGANVSYSGENHKQMRVGGAIISSRSNISISSTSFTNNHISECSRCYGAALFTSSSYTFINNSMFIDNFVNATEEGFGGAVYSKSSTFFIHSTTFSNNIATGESEIVAGSVLYATTSSDINVNNGTFFNNTCIVFAHGSTEKDNGGALYISDNSVINANSSLFLNNSVINGTRSGGAIRVDSSTMIIANCIFTNNSASRHGGAVALRSCVHTSFINSSTFISNSCGSIGGALFASRCNIILSGNNFTKNPRSSEVVGIVFSTLTINGDAFTSNAGLALYSQTSTTIISGSTFNNNAGGAGFLDASNVTICNSTFESNSFGALYIQYPGFCTIDNVIFINNTAPGERARAGALYIIQLINPYASWLSQTVILRDCTFTNNTVTGNQGQGGALYLFNTNLTGMGYLNIKNNLANTSSVHLVNSNVRFTGITNISNNYGSVYLYAIGSEVHFSMYIWIANNYGSLLAFNSNITIMGYSIIKENQNTNQGGAIAGFQSEIVFKGVSRLTYNSAIYGGAFSLTESKLYIIGEAEIAHNTASISGGGIHAYQSELNFIGTIRVCKNEAIEKGGGIYAIGTSTKFLSNSVNDYLQFLSNSAILGGGLYMESNSKLNLIKTNFESRASQANTRLEFNNNSASYGGALYVTDSTNSGICGAVPFKRDSTAGECFFQVFAVYRNDIKRSSLSNANTINIFFSKNLATEAGGTLYGGLIDRCSASPFAEIFYKFDDLTPSTLKPQSYFLNSTNIEPQFFAKSNVSSDPVRVCFCRNNQPQCNYQLPPKYVRKGETFTVSLVAVDHVNNTIPNTIVHASLSLLRGNGLGKRQSKAGLSERQFSQTTNMNGSCTDLTYSVLSPQNYEQLLLYADGPCVNLGISVATLTVNIAPCPIGFNDSETGLRCGCDPTLYPQYVSSCSVDIESVMRKDTAWFAFVNTTDYRGFAFHEYCPFDYCRPSSEIILVNLNNPSGSDALCAFNRSGKLCGSCEDGLSLSLGSSRCILCSNNWLALLIFFALAGVALVAFILVFNLTVDIGTINGLIFYANIIAANRAIFLPFDKPNFLTIFIAWINLDLGFGTCFYDGLDGYANTWLQLAFPLYVLSLTSMIIFIADKSVKFSTGILSQSRTVPTLATLILLSYTKFIRIIITAFQFTRLQYSDGSQETVWLFDANIPYFSLKHIPLFVMALIIFIISLAFTLLLFFWQWFYSHSESSKYLKWLTNLNLAHFVRAYHGPYVDQHRYWTGLLLFVRGILYIISATNVVNNPSVNLISIICVVGGLMFLTNNLGNIYRDNIVPLDDSPQNGGGTNTRVENSDNNSPNEHSSTKMLTRFKEKTITFFKKDSTIYIFNMLIPTLERSYIFNLILFAAFSLYNRESNGDQVALASTMTSIAFLTFLVTVVFHSRIYVFNKATLRRLKRKIGYLLKPTQNRFPKAIGPKHTVTMEDDDDQILGYIAYEPSSSFTVVEKPEVIEDSVEVNSYGEATKLTSSMESSFTNESY